MKSEELFTNCEKPEVDKSKLPMVVRVKSNYYEDSRGGLVMKRTARTLRRRSGWGLVDCLREEISCVNDFLEWLMGEIKEDGVYEIDAHWTQDYWGSDGELDWTVEKVGD